jgi:hypothetical protein
VRVRCYVAGLDGSVSDRVSWSCVAPDHASDRQVREMGAAHS